MKRRGLLLVTTTILLAACTTATAGKKTAIRRTHEQLHPQAGGSSCDVYRGSWVVDASYPLYDAASCPFVRKEFDCRRMGRPDTMYLKYRWQPDPPCSLPRFVDRSALNSITRRRTAGCRRPCIYR